MSGFDGYDTGADGRPTRRSAPERLQPLARPTAPAQPASAPVADAAEGNWVDAAAPNKLKPYFRLARFDRLIGAWLLLLPGWQSIILAGAAAGWDARALATYGWHSVAWLFIAIAIGAVVMRGAGCVLNDMVDRDIDRQVDRTRSRPLASGAVKMWQAALLLAALCLIGLMVLLTFNTFSIWLGVASLLPVAIYPFMKRITFFPQVFLGIAFSWGALLGWAAMAGSLDWPPIFLYIGSVAWVIGYDTIYAHQDREDDALIGVKSTALFFGERSPAALSVLYGIAIFFAALAGLTAGLDLWFWFGLACYSAHLILQVLRLDINDPELCHGLFKSNRDAGLLLFGAIVLGGI